MSTGCRVPLGRRRLYRRRITAKIEPAGWVEAKWWAVCAAAMASAP